MFDSAGCAPDQTLFPDLSLFVGARDEVMFVCASIHPTGGWRAKGGLIYVVIHRSHGAWTHVYRVVQDKPAGRLAVFVEKIIEGENAAAACAWGRATFAPSVVETQLPEAHLHLVGNGRPPGTRLVDIGAAAEPQRLRA